MTRRRNLRPKKFETDRLAAVALADAWVTTNSCRDVSIPASDSGATRNKIMNKLLILVAFRQFYALVRDDVGRLANLPDDPLAKRFDYWEVPPAELIDLVFRIQGTVMDVKANVQVISSRRFPEILDVCGTRGRNDYASLPLQAKADLLEARARRLASGQVNATILPDNGDHCASHCKLPAYV